MQPRVLLPVLLCCSVGLAQPFGVDDAVTMTVLGADRPAYPSPNGQRQVIVTRRGDLHTNTNRYSLYWLDRRLKPQLLVQLSSSSNRPAVEDVSWLADNDTVCFLGEQPGQKHQLYAIRCSDGKLRKLVDCPRNLVTYALTPDLKRSVYLAMPPAEPLFPEQNRRHGLVVSDQSLRSLLSDPPVDSPAKKDYSEHYELIVQTAHGSAKKVAMPDNPWAGAPLTLSPDGRFLVLSAMMRDIPPEWADYQDTYLKSQFMAKRPAGTLTNLWRWYLVDLQSAQARPLLNAPGYGAGQALWSSDGRSLIISRCYAPLQGVDSEERKRRQGGPFTLEVDRAAGTVRRIGPAQLEPLSWVGQTATFQGKDGQIAFRKTEGEWKPAPALLSAAPGPLRVQLEEGMNSPPRLYALDASTGHRSLLLDLNPDLVRTRTLAEVREIEWKGSDGVADSGGLYLPVGKCQQRCPLVIQTHGWEKDRFSPEGLTRSGYAAQALANQGFVVVQVKDNIAQDVLTPREGPRAVAAYEGLIDLLDSQALIDRHKVALVGWSRSCFYVKYALTHSKYPFAAAMVCDGFDASYFQYITNPNGESEALNRGVPFGKNLASWLSSAPGFQIAEVTTPLLIQAPNRGSVLGEWEWFSALRRLNRPVEMLLLESGSHDLTRPWDCQVSQQATVDWMRFWLQGYEAPGRDPQNARWRELRQLKPYEPGQGSP